MRVAILWGLVTWLSATSPTSVVSQEPDFPRLANYYLHGHVDPDHIAELARWDLVILKTVWTEAQLQELRSLNPTIKIYLYVCVYCVESPANPSDPWAVQMHHYAEDYDLWWYNSDGEVASDWPGARMINVITPQARGPVGDWLSYLERTLVQLVIDRPSIDGLFFDNYWQRISWNQEALRLDSDCHPRYNPAGCDGQPDTKQTLDYRWNATMRDFASRMRTRFDALQTVRPRPLTLLTNSSSDYFESLNGTLYEFFPGGSTPDFGSPFNYAWRTSMFLSPGGYLVAPFRTAPYSVSVINASWHGNTQTPLRSEGFERHKRFTFGSALLGDGYYSLDTGPKGHGNLWWEPEFDNGGFSKGYLGQPLGPARSVAPVGVGNYLRNGDFEAGLEHWNTGFTHVDGSGVASGNVVHLALKRLFHISGHARLSQTDVSLRRNKAHTLRFTGQAITPTAIEVSLTSGDCPEERCMQNWRFDLGPVAQEYAVSFIAPATTEAHLNFVLRDEGLVRLRNVSLRNGSQDIYRRDFENGSVVVNYTTQTQLLDHGRYLTRLSIPGSDVFDGRTVRTDFIPTGDAVIYLNHGGVGKPSRSASDPAPSLPRLDVASHDGMPRIAFEVAHGTRTAVEVFDVRGHRVAQLRAPAPAAAGRHHIDWDNRGGDARLSPGVYFVRLQTPRAAVHRKVVLSR